MMPYCEVRNDEGTIIGCETLARLDFVHDPLAREALHAYADAARREGLIILADDLERALAETA